MITLFSHVDLFGHKSPSCVLISVAISPIYVNHCTIKTSIGKNVKREKVCEQ